MQKVLNIRDEIINKRPGVYFINKDLEDKLKETLKKLNDENLFNRYGMSYVYRYSDEDISLVIHKEINY